jgi:deoxyribodipyrimidine photo-lyase
MSDASAAAARAHIAGMILPEPTRAAALARLEAFAPAMGRAYAATRNHDHGPGERGNVSLLSPHVRHRLVTEQELVAAALAHHAPPACEKFVQEVFWRSYWKGWLEQRPSVWTAYRALVAQGVAALATQGGLRRAYEDAVSARTGIACFDAWARELAETGYLHNHARMWFASIWIFTLRLPWALGADLTYRHFADGDPASNTLSWRWVAGLHTRGKHYLARASNIAEYTGGRFDPRGALDERAPPLEAEPPAPALPLPPPDPAPEGDVALLVTEEDCLAETLPLGRARVIAVAGAACTGARSPLPVGAVAERFASAALDDALARAGSAFGVSPERLATFDDVAGWVAASGARTFVTAHASVGPVAEALDRAGPALAARGIRLVRLRRAWDDAVWPHATRGFFQVKGRIPAILRALGHKA